MRRTGRARAFHTPRCIRGFWLLRTFLTETKCLFVLREAQARPCEPGGWRGHEALAAGAGHPGVQHAPVPAPVGSSRGPALAGTPPTLGVDPAGCFTAAGLCSPCQTAPALPSPIWDLPSLGEKSPPPWLHLNPTSASHECRAVRAAQGVPGRGLSPILLQGSPLEGDVSCSSAMGSSAGPFPPGALALRIGLTPTPVAAGSPHLCLARRWDIHPR